MCSPKRREAMSVALMIIGIICFAGALWLLFSREVLAPATSLLGLVSVYFSYRLPLAPNMVITWVALTVIVMGVSFMQPAAVMAQKRGMGYMTIGAIAGMAVGLISVSATTSLTAQYACMIVGVLAGIFFGFMLFSRTPDAAAVRFPSSRFFSYLAAKGFPLAITIIQPGIVIMLSMLPQ